VTGRALKQQEDWMKRLSETNLDSNEA